MGTMPKQIRTDGPGLKSTLTLWEGIPRAREVMRLYLRERYTQAEIGESLGISQQHVARIIGKAIAVIHTNGGAILEIDV